MTTDLRPATRYGRDITRDPLDAARSLLRAVAVALVLLALVTADTRSDPRYLVVLAAAFLGWVIAWTVVAVLGRVRA